MRVLYIAQDLDVTPAVVRKACQCAIGICPDTLDDLTPGQALEVVAWLQEGRYDALRRRIQREAVEAKPGRGGAS
jgi:hypothetical protein